MKTHPADTDSSARLWNKSSSEATKVPRASSGAERLLQEVMLRAAGMMGCITAPIHRAPAASPLGPVSTALKRPVR